MFIGHQAAALAAKRVTPHTSLGVLMGAAMLLDLIWPVLVLTGVEKVRIDPGNTAFTPLAFDFYPFSHSLVTSLAMSIVAVFVYRGVTRDSTGALTVGACVFSHWVLDFISHGQDMPLAPGLSLRVGLGLWNSVPATIGVEVLMFVGGVWLYTQTMRPHEKGGRWSLWILIGFLGLTYLGNAFGPPPPSPKALAWVALTVCLLPLWAGWVDRQRIRAR